MNHLYIWYNIHSFLCFKLHVCVKVYIFTHCLSTGSYTEKNKSCMVVQIIMYTYLLMQALP